MDNQPSGTQKEPNSPQAGKTVKTTVTCPHCGKDHEVTVQVPESDDAPKMAWQG